MVSYANKNKIPVVIQSGAGDKKPGLTQMSELSLQKTRWLIYVFSTFLLGICALYFIVGIIYLTAFYQPYSFTAFSTTLCAALFITWSGLLLIIIGFNVFFVRSSKNTFSILTAVAAIVLFIVLIAIGGWGIYVNNNGRLREWIRYNFMDTLQWYDETRPTSYATAKIDWLQDTYKCCGLETSQDWRSFYLYGRGSGAGPNLHENQHHPNQNFFGTPMQLQQQGNVYSGLYGNPFSASINSKYIDQVPDSCCVQKYFNCGKNGNRFPNAGNMYGQNYHIYTQGCFSWYLPRLQRDYNFIAGFSLGISIIGLVGSAAFIGLFFYYKNKLFYH